MISYSDRFRILRTGKSRATDYITALNSNITARYTENGRINVYVGVDGKLHFVNRDGADTALNFSSGLQYYIGTWEDRDANRSTVIPITLSNDILQNKSIQLVFAIKQAGSDGASDLSWNPSPSIYGNTLLLQTTITGANTFQITTDQYRFSYGSYIVFF